jgi:DNA-binding protein HU-beta
MNKKELVKKVASRVGNTQKNTQDIIETACEVIMEEIANGERVSLQGFGSFSQKTRKGYRFHSKFLNKVVDIPDKKLVKFSPSSLFKGIL